MSERDEDPLHNRVIIEADKRLSQSLIWQIQRTYFLNSGMTPWQDDVLPHYISSNPVMARAYSQLVFGYVRDCVAAANAGTFTFDRTQPLTFVELGAGTGRLAYHFLSQFYPLFEDSPYGDIPLHFILTDFVPEIVDFWMKQPKLMRLAEAGILDFALFDVMEQRPLTLQHAQTTLQPEDVQNPLILFANYFFDSIPQDSFVIEDGVLCENLLTLTSSQAELSLTEPKIWDRLEFVYEHFPLQRPFYKNPQYNAILDDYEATFPDTELTFPIFGLECLQFWQQYGNGRLLLLTSDKGNTLPDSLVNQKDTMPKLHGSFSMMVNYHAINQFVEMNGGLALNTPHYQDNLQVIAYLMGDQPQAGAETQLAFNDAVVQGGPDDFFALENVMTKQYENMNLAQLLGFLRFSAWDAVLFRDCYAELLTQIRQSEPSWYPDVYNALIAIWRQYLPIHEKDDLLILINQLIAQMGLEEELFLNEY